MLYLKRLVSRLFVIIFLGFVFLALSSTPVHATGESYAWDNSAKDQINASGGSYASGVRFPLLQQSGNTYSGAATDRASGCPITVVFTANAAGTGGTVDIIPPGPPEVIGTPGCNPSALGSYSKNVTIDGSGLGNPSLNNTSLTVQAVVEGGDFPGDSDTITIKNKAGTTVAKKNATTEIDGGFEVKFATIPVGDYQACSAALTMCVDFTQTVSTDPLLSKTVVISKGETSSCVLDGVGWIICPATRFLAGLTDQVFNILDGMFEIDATFFSTSGPGYRLWGQVRNLANVAFVIAFMFVVYSQITGAGITNYGLKKLLPKLVIAAVLVNISWWICAVFVDLSNIAGYSVKALLDSASGAVSAGGNSLSFWDQVAAWILTGGLTALAIGGVTLAALGAGGVLGALAALLPLMIAALFAVFVVMMILAARQALIIVLIVISPLAFVAYLLPNTEGWYKRWLKTLGVLLLVFPMIALVFGGAKLAAFVVQDTADNAITFIFSLAIAAIPLYVTPLLLKFSGGVLNRFGGIVNDMNRGPFDRLRKTAEGARDRQQNRSRNAAMNSPEGQRNPFRRYLRRNARLEATDAAQQAGFKRATVGHIAGEAENNERFRAQLARGGGEGAAERALADAISTKAKFEAEEVSAANILQKGLGYDERKTIATTGVGRDGVKVTEAQRVAAINHIMDNGNFDDRQAVIKSVGSMGTKELQATSEGYYKSGMQSVFGAQFGGAIAEGGVGGSPDDIASRLSSEAMTNIEQGKLKAETLAGDGDVAGYLRKQLEKAKQDGTLSARAAENARTAARTAGTSPSLEGQRTAVVKDHLEKIESI